VHINTIRGALGFISSAHGARQTGRFSAR
jgi:hypothetical protein